MKRKAETRATNAADRMAALLEDLRPLLDAYRCRGAYATEEDAREALDFACADTCACIEFGWTVGNLDEVLLTDPGFKCFKGRLAPDEAHFLHWTVYGVQVQAHQLVGALRTYYRHRATDFMDSTVEELRRLLIQEDAEAARGADGMTTAENGARETVRRYAERWRVATLRSVAAAQVLDLWDQYRAGETKPRYSAFIDQHGGAMIGNGVTAKAALQSIANDGEAEADALKRLCNGRAQNRRRGRA